MKHPLLLPAALILLLIAAVPLASAAPSIAPDDVEAVTTEPNSTFTFNVTATNEGGDKARTSIVVDKETLPDGFSVTNESGTKPIAPSRSATFTIGMRVGEVEPGEYSFQVFDLTNTDRKTRATVNVTVVGPTPTETEVETETATPTATPTEPEKTPTQEPTGTPTGTPGFGPLAGAAGICAALVARRR